MFGEHIAMAVHFSRTRKHLQPKIFDTAENEPLDIKLTRTVETFGGFFSFYIQGGGIGSAFIERGVLRGKGQ